jgi:hypothetical protein
MKPRVEIKILLAMLALALLAGCGLPASTPFVPTATVSAEEVATQVAAVLTSTAIVIPPSPIPASPTAPQVDTATPEPTPVGTITATLAPATPTQEPTATSAPTATPTTAPTATNVVGDPRNTLGGATFSDRSFRENINWGRAWENDFTRGSFENSQMVLTSIGVDGWTLSWPEAENFYIEMTATTGDCSGSDRWGLITRVPNQEPFDTGYLAGLTCDGRYSLRFWDPDEKQYAQIVPWTASDIINEGSNQTNRLGLWAEDNTFKIYINGQLVKTVEDDRLEGEGLFGPWVGHADGGEFTIYISEISYWELP